MRLMKAICVALLAMVAPAAAETFNLGNVTLHGTVTVTPAVNLYPTRYRQDFITAGELDHWGSSSSFGSVVADGVFRSAGPWADDANHIDGIGMLSLLAYRVQAGWEQLVNGVYVGPDFTNAAFKIRVRGINFVPNQAKVMPWLQSRHPSDQLKFANWGMTGIDITPLLLDGQWHDFQFIMEAKPELWTYAGNNAAQPNPERYSFLPLRTSLEHMHNLHFPAVRPLNTPAPSGTFEIDYVEVLYLRKGTPLAAPVDGTVVFDPLLNTASTGNAGSSFRGISTAISTGGTQARVTFTASPSASTSANRLAIGKRASGWATTAVPVELKFSGVSGFSIAAGAQITSDWVDLGTAAGDVLVTVIDSTSSGQARTAGAFAGGTAIGPAPSYNVAAPSGTAWWTTSQILGGRIEVR